MYGIDNLKKLINFGCSLTKQIVTSGSDGWQWTDMFSFVDELSQIPGVIKAFPDIQKELADLSDDEKKELQTYLSQEFDIPNDKVEAFVEAAVMQAVSLVTLYDQWKQLKSQN